MPMSEGIQRNCHWWLMEDYPCVGNQIPNRIEAEDYVQQKGLKNILNIEFDRVVENYDNATRAIFEHFLGSNDPRVDPLVKAAIKHDIGRWSEAERAAHGHVSNSSEKALVLSEMKRLFQAGDPCMQSLVQADMRLGYGSPF